MLNRGWENKWTNYNTRRVAKWNRFFVKKVQIKNKTNLVGYFFECIYKDYPVIISKTKMGEISSAIATTLAIQKYNPLFILNQGTAGAFVEWLDKEDVLLGKNICYISKKTEYRTIDNEVVSYNADSKFLNW